MKRIIYSCFFSAACVFHPLIAAEENATCNFIFSTPHICQYKNISALLISKKISDDEIKLEEIELDYQKNKSILSITSNTYMLEGDSGYISFADINFDGVADISITTSFGLANLYLDYWVYYQQKKQYVYIGNFTKFKFNDETKILSNRMKLNAYEYKTSHYYWRGYKLLKQVNLK